ncbi:MAG: ASCH domain-containing protein [Aggregatilineales bacterium]
MRSSSTIWDTLPEQLSRPKFAKQSIDHDSFWSNYEQNGTEVTIHLAILATQYINLILDGKKTVESRFSIHKRMPYKRINPGDIIFLKETGGPIRGICYVSKTEFFDLKKDVSLSEIMDEYRNELQIHDISYWQRYKKANYATLIHLENVRAIDPMPFSKRDRNAWVIF